MKSTYITIFIIAILVFTFLLWKHGIPNSINNWLALIVAAIGGGTGGMIAGNVSSFIFILFASKESNGILGEHEYKITAEGLYEKTCANEELSKWEGIQEIKIIGPYVLFRISDYLFYVIPKRSFSSTEAFNLFTETSLAYWKKLYDNTNQ